jgi:hypothetical protein
MGITWVLFSCQGKESVAFKKHPFLYDYRYDYLVIPEVEAECDERGLRNNEQRE